MLRVNCGVTSSGVETTTSTNEEWALPVFYIKPLPCLWTPPQDTAFSLLFTSQSALHVFLKHIFPRLSQTSLWHRLKHVAAVGAHTAQACTQQLPSFLQKHPVVYPAEHNGLLATLALPPLQSDPIFIFTNVLGKSEDVLRQQSQSEQKRIHALPIYTLEPHNPREFLDSTLQLKERVIQMPIVFCCKSGLILEQTVLLLTQYFNLKNPLDLPDNILFSVWEQSAEHALQKFQLEKRNVPWSTHAST